MIACVSSQDKKQKSSCQPWKTQFTECKSVTLRRVIPAQLQYALNQIDSLWKRADLSSILAADSLGRVSSVPRACRGRSLKKIEKASSERQVDEAERSYSRELPHGPRRECSDARWNRHISTRTPSNYRIKQDRTDMKSVEENGSSENGGLLKELVNQCWTWFSAVRLLENTDEGLINVELRHAQKLGTLRAQCFELCSRAGCALFQNATGSTCTTVVFCQRASSKNIWSRDGDVYRQCNTTEDVVIASLLVSLPAELMCCTMQVVFTVANAGGKSAKAAHVSSTETYLLEETI